MGMMNGVYEWVRNMAGYLILMTMIVNLLPNRTYEKYLRLFAGIVFMLLVLSPFSDLSGVNGQMEEAFARLTFQNDAKMLRREIERVDERQMKQLIERYQETIETEVKQIAEGMHMTCNAVEVEIENRVSESEFGRVRFLKIYLTGNDAEHERFRQEIGEYYGVEAGDIEIILKDE